MKSIFDQAENSVIISRINKLQSTSAAQWGKMNVAQMLTHCQAPIKIALGELQLKQNLLGLLFGKMIAKSLANDKPFDKNLPTHKNFIVANERNFEEERKKLAELVNRFGNTPPEEIISRKHPIFGMMNKEQWDGLQWKHLDHHLRQFGV